MGGAVLTLILSQHLNLIRKKDPFRLVENLQMQGILHPEQ
jgi:hypothetical protein